MNNKVLYIIFFLLITHTASLAQESEDTKIHYSDTSVTVAPYTDLLQEQETVTVTESSFDIIPLTEKEEVQGREVSSSKLASIRKDDDFWYVNEKPEREEVKEYKESSLDKLAREKWFRNLLWFLVVGGFIAILVWFILSSDIKLFKKKAPKIEKAEDAFENQNIFDINYERELQNALSANDYRLAVRLLYLQTLRNLSERNIIQYKQERTNNDYLMQLFQTNYYKDFFRLTRHFEYSWYGQFPVSTPAFEVIKNDFFLFNKKVA